MVQQRPVKSEIDLEDREMFEVLLDTVDREDFFDKGFPGNDFGAFGYVALVPVWRVNLSEPADITVTRRPDENLGMEIAEMKFIQLVFGHKGSDGSRMLDKFYEPLTGKIHSIFTL